MQPSEQGLALIRRFEGFCATPYRCPAGYLTIGYGHRVGARESFPEPLSPEQAEALLARDAGAAGAAVSRYVTVALAQCQFDALTSFVFNLGAMAFARSTLLQVVNKGWHAEVPAQLMRWVNAGGKPLPGLAARRAAEAELYEGDTQG